MPGVSTPIAILTSRSGVARAMPTISSPAPISAAFGGTTCIVPFGMPAPICRP